MCPTTIRPWVPEALRMAGDDLAPSHTPLGGDDQDGDDLPAFLSDDGEDDGAIDADEEDLHAIAAE